MFGLFIGAFLLGENIILIAFLLSAQGYLEPSSTIIICFLGSLSADLFWYFFGNIFLPDYKVLKFLENDKFYGNRFINLLLRQNQLVTFTFIKFLVGIRLILTLGFVLIKKVSFFRYLLLCIISNSIFIIVLYGFTFLAKKGIAVLPIYHNFNTVLLSGVFLVILINLIPRIVSYYLNKN